MSLKFKAGDKVQWIAIPRVGGKREKPIKCQGVVQKVKQSIFGGMRQGMGAYLIVTTKNYKARYGVNTTFVSFSKLSFV